MVKRLLFGLLILCGIAPAPKPPLLWGAIGDGGTMDQVDLVTALEMKK